MSAETLLSIAISLPFGVICGLYSGLIVARFSRFSELRNEALRIIRSIEYMQEGKRIVVSEEKDLAKLMLISSDLLFLQHRRAGDCIATLSTAVSETNYEAGCGNVSIDAYEQRYLHWQSMVRNLQPSRKTIFSVTWNI